VDGFDRNRWIPSFVFTGRLPSFYATEPGILRSYRGPSGGVALARPADQVTIKEIIIAIDGPDLFEQCVLGLPGCGCGTPCPMHEQWATTRDEIEAQFENHTLGQLSEKIQSSRVRLTPDDLTGAEEKCL
jgi:DNA-binding IscR family transcriptional regulator